MKIGIVTQPLGFNYGGILQNFALQQVLIRMGHNPVTIDYWFRKSWLRYLLSMAKTLLLLFIPCWRRPFSARKSKRCAHTGNFISKNITRTAEVYSYSSNLIKTYGFDCVVTGSDQVWRPCYNSATLEDCFLRFVNNDECGKVAYAASFGVDDWEYTSCQTQRCAKLARNIGAISVREESGVALCREHLGVNAVETLDPTLLLSSDDYNAVCSDVPSYGKPFIAAYILDDDDKKQEILNKISAEKSLPVHRFYVTKDGGLSVEQWLAMFRDASFIVTDSFHGTVFSIIYNKDFVAISNSARGASRFESLLSKFRLESCLIKNAGDYNVIHCIDWLQVNEAKRALQDRSIDFLNKALCRK